MNYIIDAMSEYCEQVEHYRESREKMKEPWVKHLMLPSGERNRIKAEAFDITQKH